MKLIAHRGLFNGPDVNLENRPEQIELALKKGYDCEIDLWYKNGELWLGHDHPDYHIREEWLQQFGLWIHGKNLGALRWLTNTSLVYFWHQNDDYTLTSNNFIWTFPGKPLTMRSIMVMPEYVDKSLENIRDAKCYGICSDFVEIIKEQYDTPK